VPFHASALQAYVKIAFPEVDMAHVIPSEEYASLFVPRPPATHRIPFQASVLHPAEENTDAPELEAFHVIPSEEYAIRFVPPAPPATH
jgi:hypothetical protein